MAVTADPMTPRERAEALARELGLNDNDWLALDLAAIERAILAAVEAERERTLRTLASAVRKVWPTLGQELAGRFMQKKRDDDAAYMESLLSILREDEG